MGIGMGTREGWQMILAIESSCDDSSHYFVQQRSIAPLSTLTLGFTQRKAHAETNPAYGESL
jgi:tRNA A37 threonylcarbamoyltransferase TsaD